MNRLMKLAAVAMVLCAAMAGNTWAAEEGWQFNLTPYLWALGMDGDVGLGPVSVPVDVKFSDAVKDLDFGGMLAAEARNGRWGILVDGTYLKLTADHDALLGEFEARLKEWTLQGSVLYTVVDTGNTAVDLGAGGRYMGIDTKLNTPLESADLNAAEDWADPILVARVRQQITEKFYGVLYGDIGGFGVSADLTWQAMAAAGYSFNETMSLLAGYRALGYEYEKDQFSLDVVENGIVIGLQFNL